MNCEKREAAEKLKQISDFCIAKAGKTGTGGGFLPFWMHALDTAGVLKKLFEERIPQNVKDSFTEACGSAEKASAYFVFLGLVHDLGKVTSSFQAQIYQAGKFSFSFPVSFLDTLQYGSDGRKAPHSRLGEIILRYEGFSEAAASVVGAHHGRTQEPEQDWKPDRLPYELRNDLRGDAGQEAFWTSLWEELIQIFLEVSDFKSPEDLPNLDCAHLMVVAGLLSQADWIASNTAYFPLVNCFEEANLRCYPERVEKGWEKAALPSRWLCQNAHSFEKMFGFVPRPFQSELLRFLEEVKDPGLILIEAPMGLGKTEAALMAADQLSRRLKTGGVFVGLPTQATANGLLPRFADWSAKEAENSSVTFRLSHAAAQLNAFYNSLPGADSCPVGEDELPGAENKKKVSLYIHPWMNSARLALFSDFVIGTVDQALMAGLDHRYVALRHAGLAGKILILDEVHSYDTYMSQFMDRLLEWMGAYKAPVILLSATLAPLQRDKLAAAYLKGRGLKKASIRKELADLPETGYPCLTWADGQKVYRETLPYSGTHTRVTVETAVCQNLQQELEKTDEALRLHLKDGGCAGIVVNTVRTAQEVYSYVKDHLEGNVFLIHSGFTGTDRRKKEQWVLERAGKASTAEQRDRVIIIGTQVIEQSLDIDFDYLISELAPMDLLLQRIGRLHRHAFRLRPKSVAAPEVLILKPESVTDRTMQTVYSEWLLDRTQKCLPAAITIPDDIPDLVNETYAEPDPSRLTAEEKELYEKRRILITAQSFKADAHTLNSPQTGRMSHLGLDGLMRSQTIHSLSTAENSVRDIEPSLQVILLKEENGGIKSADSELFSGLWKLGECPKALHEAEILAKRVRIPGVYSLDEAEAEIRSRMQTNGIKLPESLQGEMHLRIDSNGTFELQGCSYRYSWEKGIEKLSVEDPVQTEERHE